MVTEAQGWKVKSGQYVLIDPIVFSKEKGLGLEDFGTAGMDRLLEKHECNQACKSIPMKYDDEVTRKLNLALERF